MRLLMNRSWAGLLLWTSVLGCGPSNISSDPDGGANGGDNGNGHLGGDGAPGPIDPLPDALHCGEQTFRLERGGPPDLLIVLDRSASMRDSPPAGGGSKWSQVSAALDTAVMALQGSIKWGLEV